MEQQAGPAAVVQEGGGNRLMANVPIYTADEKGIIVEVECAADEQQDCGGGGGVIVQVLWYLMMQSRVFVDMWRDASVDVDAMAIPLKKVRTECFRTIIDWMSQHDDQHHDQPLPTVNENPSTGERIWFDLTAWERTFFAALDFETLKEVFMAADYLDIRSLYLYCAQECARRIVDKDEREIRNMLCLPDNMTEEEKAAIRAEFEIAAVATGIGEAQLGMELGRHHLPADLGVEIVDCLSLENMLHFLANVPNQMIVHHCVLRVRRMLQMINRVANEYAENMPSETLFGAAHDEPVAVIAVRNGLNYTPELGIFLRHGARYASRVTIYREARGLVGHPANFFDQFIEHLYTTSLPTMAICHVAIHFPWDNPAPWPVPLRPVGGHTNVVELMVDNDGGRAVYLLRNKHNSDIRFQFEIRFEGGAANLHHQMTSFTVVRLG